MTRVRTALVTTYAVALVSLMASACGSPSRTAVAPTPPQVAAPTVALVAPSEAPSTSSTAIRITGSGFQPGATVRLGGVAITATVESPFVIAATAPPRDIGQVDVVVTNPDGQSARRAAAFTYVGTGPAGTGDLHIRPGESLTSTLAGTVLWCTFESVACQRLFVDAPASETIELEVTPAESGRQVGLFLTEPFLAPTTYPTRLTVAGGQRPFIMGAQAGYTLTARRQGSTP